MARREVPRGAHAAVGNVDRDPVDLVELSSRGRIRRLVPLRYGRMLASPFAFFRGSAILQAHDLAGTPHTGILIPICGDAHLANFGGFATPERTLLLDINDFDETSTGPWEWDLKRLVTSFVLAARQTRRKRGVADDLVHALVRTYQSRMRAYAESGILDTWYDLVTFERLLAEEPSPEIQKRIRRGMERAADRTHEALLPKLTRREGDRLTILDAPPAVFHALGSSTLFDADDEVMRIQDREAVIQSSFREYLGTLPPDRRRLLLHFVHQDTAFKVVGVGSVGTRCLIQLLMDGQGKPLFLQIKEASVSVVARYFKAPGPKSSHEGRRVVEGQRLMQAASDLFLGWTTGPFGQHFHVRQLRDMKYSVQVELMDAELMERYARTCGWVLARAHAKGSGRAAEIAGYLGRSDRMADALVAYANAYADQAERDHDCFASACRSGRLEARTDEDMAADFRV
ncbi:DUF2252 domain-containing protein [Piscinibacter gummiphilus]|uniref:Uncharacterized protein n=1 Tax=Piscinibacter gummiphilus TaxID=946333 RepID=A0A1W6LCR2_9BURK|nr:DUF2252 domain-containing protein [Piscinibacter gummiphilus]ARN22029.1 hypothetical protein A4W93_20180 [Piscinibacter gummiphilus]ATU66714.1 DUF2252 domain-containing protein [Piscinibacter gummiphilus]GLS94107.1 hypothetical protein GCM10007918_13990 [Piscinibacter gummiphilus]